MTGWLSGGHDDRIAELADGDRRAGLEDGVEDAADDAARADRRVNRTQRGAGRNVDLHAHRAGRIAAQDDRGCGRAGGPDGPVVAGEGDTGNGNGRTHDHVGGGGAGTVTQDHVAGGDAANDLCPRGGCELLAGEEADHQRVVGACAGLEEAGAGLDDRDLTRGLVVLTDVHDRGGRGHVENPAHDRIAAGGRNDDAGARGERDVDRCAGRDRGRDVIADLAEGDGRSSRGRRIDGPRRAHPVSRESAEYRRTGCWASVEQQTSSRRCERCRRERDTGRGDGQRDRGGRGQEAVGIRAEVRRHRDRAVHLRSG